MVRNKFISGILSVLVSLNFCTYAHAQEHFRLHFARNESEFFNTLLDNEKTLDSLQKWVKNTTPERILSIDVSVFASPEGPKEFNEELCRERAEEFYTAVLPYFKGAEDKVNIHIGGEAWEELRMRVANDKKLRPEYIEQILSILDDKSIDNETRKQHIATRISEHNYRFLLWEHYRLLRYYDIFITVKPEQTEKAIEQVELESTEEKPVNEVETEVAEVNDNDELYFSVNLPNIICGCVGNGKDLDFVKENLKLIGCLDENYKVIDGASERMAKIICAVVFCGELSLMSALTNQDELVKSHIKIERKK